MIVWEDNSWRLVVRVSSGTRKHIKMDMKNRRGNQPKLGKHGQLHVYDEIIRSDIIISPTDDVFLLSETF